MSWVNILKPNIYYDDGLKQANFYEEPYRGWDTECPLCGKMTHDNGGYEYCGEICCSAWRTQDHFHSAAEACNCPDRHVNYGRPFCKKCVVRREEH